MTELSREFMGGLYREQKVLTEDITWEHGVGPQQSFQSRVRTVRSNHLLTVRGEIWGKGYSFSLHYRNNIIRLWDFNNHHEGISGGHKHPFTPDGEYGEPYSVDDVSTSDVNQALIDFLEECSIDYQEATINRPTKLDDYV